MAHPLPLTGERTVPGVAGEEYWFARHEAAYRWLVTTYAEELTGGVVVEAGSGEGYGAQMLIEAGARTVLALEYDEAAVAHAGSAYPGVTTLRANLADVPVADARVDVLVTMQVVEHLWDLRGFLRDCARVLRPAGRIVVTTPNRPIFSPGLRRGEKPTNPFHVEEFDADQLHDLLREAGFAEVTVHGLHHGPRIEAWEQRSGTTLVAAQLDAVLHPPRDPDQLAVTRPGKPPVDQGDGWADLVSSVGAEDFVVGAASGSQDLVAVGVRP